MAVEPTPSARLRARLPVALQGDYLFLWIALLVESFAMNMVAVAIGWQVYAISGSAFDLGLIGLAEFVPLLVLAIPAGQLADRVPRRLLLGIALAFNALVPILLLVVTIAGESQVWPFLLLATGNGIASSMVAPAGRALGPALVSDDVLPSALALRSIAFQSGTVAGPALGGFLFSIRPEVAYAAAAGMFVAAAMAVFAIREPRQASSGPREAVTIRTLLAGVTFIRRTPVMLGAITLDLFAVLFGGAVALLPLFARTILHTGPIGLGILRSAPAVGALAAGIMLTRRPVRGRTGVTLLSVVAAFGVAMIVFGLSKSFPLSLGALAIAGFVDMISVNIRSTIPVVAAPDELRGRVVAVETVFISASNELGAFESGAAAALLGAVPAVVVGGALTIALAAIWKWVFPALAHIDRLDELRPEPLDVTEPIGAPGAAV